MGRIGGNAYLPRGASPRKGRAGQGTGRYSWLAPQWGLADSHPTTHLLGSQSAAKGGCEPQTGTQGGIHYWGLGVPQHLAELKPNLFFRMAPENQPRTTMVQRRWDPTTTGEDQTPSQDPHGFGGLGVVNHLHAPLDGTAAQPGSPDPAPEWAVTPLGGAEQKTGLWHDPAGDGITL